MLLYRDIEKSSSVPETPSVVAPPLGPGWSVVGLKTLSWSVVGLKNPPWRPWFAWCGWSGKIDKRAFRAFLFTYPASFRFETATNSHSNMFPFIRSDSETAPALMDSIGTPTRSNSNLIMNDPDAAIHSLYVEFR